MLSFRYINLNNHQVANHFLYDKNKNKLKEKVFVSRTVKMSKQMAK